jgi:hypothetical protein
MPFNPKSEYTIVPKDISIKDFHEYKEDFVTRPPYQRRAVKSPFCKLNFPPFLTKK